MLKLLGPILAFIGCVKGTVVDLYPFYPVYNRIEFFDTSYTWLKISWEDLSYDATVSLRWDEPSSMMECKHTALNYRIAAPDGDMRIPIRQYHPFYCQDRGCVSPYDQSIQPGAQVFNGAVSPWLNHTLYASFTTTVVGLVDTEVDLDLSWENSVIINSNHKTALISLYKECCANTQFCIWPAPTINTKVCQDIYGVDCDQQGNVQRLLLDNMGMSCSLGTMIDTFASTLDTLFISHNDFFGTFPSLGPKVRFIHASNNLFTGNIPVFTSTIIEDLVH